MSVTEVDDGEDDRGGAGAGDGGGGEDLEAVSRSLGVRAATVSGWRDAFPAAGEAALTTKTVTAEELEADRLKAKVGELTTEGELLREKIARLETGRPLAWRRPPAAATASPRWRSSGACYRRCNSDPVAD
jgi:transposase-like protein